MMKWLRPGSGVAFGIASAYGWWFHFSVGPAHGPGAELGILAGTATLAIVAWAVWSHRKRMSSEPAGAQSDRTRLIRDLVAECEARAPERIDRYLDAQHTASLRTHLSRPLQQSASTSSGMGRLSLFRRL